MPEMLAAAAMEPSTEGIIRVLQTAPANGLEAALASLGQTLLGAKS